MRPWYLAGMVLLGVMLVGLAANMLEGKDIGSLAPWAVMTTLLLAGLVIRWTKSK